MNILQCLYKIWKKIKAIFYKEEVPLDKKDMSLDKKKVPLEQIEFYKNYWKCRDFELQHLWQRSVFLSAFLTLCCTSYGYMITHFFIDKPFSITANVVCIILCIIGVLFSYLWICMAKGSKAWYEIYEEKISKFERECAIKGNIKGCNNTFSPDIIGKSIEMSDCPFDNKAGKFSPSKINIAIGQIFIIGWSCGFIFHNALCFIGCKSIISICINIKYIFFALMSLCFIAVMVQIVKFYIKSSTLKDYKK